MKLELADPLLRLYSTSKQKLFAGAFKTEETRRVWNKSEINPYGTNWRSIPDSKSDRMDHVIEIRVIVLTNSKGNILDLGVYVAGIVEYYAAKIFSK